MKRKARTFLVLLSTLLTLCLLLSVVSPVLSASILSSQYWNLDILDTYRQPSDDTGLAEQGLLQMEKLGGPGDNGQGVYIYNSGTGTWEYDHPGEIILKADGGSQIWIADEIATTNILFDGGELWELELVTNSDWDPDDCGIRIGQWNGTLFVSFSTSGFTEPISWDIGTDKTVLRYELQTGSEVLFSNSFLAIEIANKDSTSNHPVYCGEGLYSSHLTSLGAVLAMPAMPAMPPPDPFIPLAPGISWIGLGILTAGFTGLSILLLTRRKSPDI